MNNYDYFTDPEMIECLQERMEFLEYENQHLSKQNHLLEVKLEELQMNYDAALEDLRDAI